MRRTILFLHLFLLLVLAIIAILNPAVGGEGDTIMHYFWAKYALEEPAALFNNWAKPFFTLWSSPWTYFGFKGIKLFNIVCGVASSYVASLYALERNWKNPFGLIVISFIGPAYIGYLNSGLTEPFSALVLILGIYILAKNESKYNFWAYLLLSFLPFCRSEAIILLPLFALYAILKRDFVLIPVLLSGTILYSLVGFVYHDSLAWAFKSPYVSGASVYGSGEWNHYLIRLDIMLSKPLLILYGIGVLGLFYRGIQKRKVFQKEVLLLVLPSLAFIGAHSTVWTLGIYASAGLERVLILVFPLIWLIILWSYNELEAILKSALPNKLGLSLKLGLPVLLIFSSLLSTFSNKSELGFYFQQAFHIDSYQKKLKEHVLPRVEKEFENQASRLLVADLPYFSLISEHNPLNHKEQVNWQRVEKGIYEQLNRDAIFLWDSHNVPFYTSIDEENLKEITWLDVITEWEIAGRKYILLKANNSFPKTKAAN